MFHPDKGGDEEKFKALSCAHAILSHPEKRKVYDETGELDASCLSEEAAEWTAYFRAMFPKLTIEMIEKFSTKYKYSEEERNDILEAYKKREGNLEEIMETVILAEEDERGRIVEIINAAVRAAEVPRYEPWPILSLDSAYSAAKKKPRKSIALDENRGRKKQQHQNDQDALLIAMIANRNKTADAFSNIYEKYSKGSIGRGGISSGEEQVGKGKRKGKGKGKGGNRGSEYDLDDADFETFQKGLFGKGKDSNRS